MLGRVRPVQVGCCKQTDGVGSKQTVGCALQLRRQQWLMRHDGACVCWPHAQAAAGTYSTLLCWWW